MSGGIEMEPFLADHGTDRRLWMTLYMQEQVDRCGATDAPRAIGVRLRSPSARDITIAIMSSATLSLAGCAPICENRGGEGTLLS